MAKPVGILSNVIRCIVFAMTILLCSQLEAQRSMLPIDSTQSAEDSLWISLLKSVLPVPGFHIPDTLQMTTPQLSLKIDSVRKLAATIELKSAFIQYNVNYRSRIDTPYAENDILQHTAAVNAQFVVGGNLPLNLLYFERQSNSVLFRDYRDITLTVNGPELQRMRAENMRRVVDGRIKELQDKSLLTNLKSEQRKQLDLEQYLSGTKLLTLLVHSKEQLLFMEQRNLNSNYEDSVKKYSQLFIDFYEKTKKQLDSLGQRVDSLKASYVGDLKKIQQLRKISNGQINAGQPLATLRDSLQKAGIDNQRLRKYSGLFNSLQKLSVGRTSPDISPLTVKDVNVKGVSAEFNNYRWYFSFTAGIVDFRLRDFINRNAHQPSQMIYAGRTGWGRKDGTHLYVTGYKGEKQIYSFNRPAVNILGTSVELQYVVRRSHKLKVEVAQSSAPNNIISGAPAGNMKFDISNKTGRAYHLQWNSYFPRLKARIDGFYQHTGYSFQSFNSYRVNAAAETWSLKYEQYFFKRQLKVLASVRKNEYENPFIIQQYNSNTVFKTLQASFRRRNWPMLTFGYLPSSQFTILDNQIYENKYQTLMSSISHNYRFGEAKGSTQVFYSQFFNSGSDTGFLYSNANHLSIYQQWDFALHTAVMSATITRSPQFSLSVYQVGASTNVKKFLQVEVGAKISHLNQLETKVGLYSRARISIPWLGDINFWYDDAFLPGYGRTLIRNQQMNLGFARRIK